MLSIKGKRRWRDDEEAEKVYGEMELKKFSWTYQKSKISSRWRSSKKRDVAWAHLWMPCARNVECLRQSLRVREQPERCDGIGYRDLSKAKFFRCDSKQKQKRRQSMEQNSMRWFSEWWRSNLNVLQPKNICLEFSIKTISCSNFSTLLSSESA
jgi:hypothetical protein